MCGIVGIMAFTEEGKKYLDKIDDAVKSLRHRGPDGHGVFRHGNVALGHTRLAIIDTSDVAAQPFTSSDGRYTIVFNGEIFNYKELRAELEKEGYTFRSNSDTEVLLTMYAKEGKECLNKLNGYFAFAVYDIKHDTLFLARDRYGEKPLYCENSNLGFRFASTLSSLLTFWGSIVVDEAATSLYCHLNYIPGHKTIGAGIEQLQPGSYRFIKSATQGKRGFWYLLPNWFVLQQQPERKLDRPTYEVARKQVAKLCDEAVARRLVSDVPLGSFLSGGVDSSIVTAIAKKHKGNLETFSIGFADEPYFDETKYADAVSKHLGTNHHVFSLRNSDLLESLHVYLHNLDEPFADSSALALNILAERTRKHVTVALSGDGADELFGGYNKHAAELLIRSNGIGVGVIKAMRSLWSILPASRNSALGSKILQLRKFAEVSSMSARDRYWRLAGFTNNDGLARLLKRKTILDDDIEFCTAIIRENGDFNDFLAEDFQLVLEGDMLVKVDRMSMLNSLEVRSPFLDHELVEYVMQLPSEYKINRHERKRILKDACRDLLPPEIFSRKKQGFEVPLLKWFRGDLCGMIDELLDEKFLKEQNLFNPEEVKNIRKQLHSNDPGDSAARIWGLIVFQSWWKKYLA